MSERRITRLIVQQPYCEIEYAVGRKPSYLTQGNTEGHDSVVAYIESLDPAAGGEDGFSVHYEDGYETVVYSNTSGIMYDLGPIDQKEDKR